MKADHEGQDAIVTDESLGMPTSAGSAALATLTAKRNATLVNIVNGITAHSTHEPILMTP